MAHLYEFRKYRESRHGKRLKRVMARMIAYCKKKNWWADEMARRLAPKVVVIPTLQEEKALRIAHRKEQLASYEKKLGYWTKLYTGKIRKARRSIMMMERGMHAPLHPNIHTQQGLR